MIYQKIPTIVRTPEFNHGKQPPRPKLNSTKSMVNAGYRASFIYAQLTPFVCAEHVVLYVDPQNACAYTQYTIECRLINRYEGSIDLIEKCIYASLSY